MNEAGKISASMMCANPFKLAEIMRDLELGGVSYLHQDIMDGRFVPNLGISLDHLKFMRRNTKIPFDFHVMTVEPDNIVPLLEPREGDIVSIHYESTFQVQRTLETVRRFGCKVFVAINPATSLSVLDEVVQYVDGINLLMVNPGFAGQKAVASCFRKAERLQRFICACGRGGIEVEVDGNVTVENARLLRRCGATVFVAGTSSLFGEAGIKAGSVAAMKAAIV